MVMDVEKETDKTEEPSFPDSSKIWWELIECVDNLKIKNWQNFDRSKSWNV